MNDDIIFQPEKREPDPDPAGDKPTKDSNAPDSDSGESKVFDFSSDLNISVVKDDQDKMGGAVNPFKGGKMPFITIVPQRPIQSKPNVLSMEPPAAKPAVTIPTPPPTPSVQATQPTQPSMPSVPKIDPFRETISADTEWPFASPQTIATRKEAVRSTPSVFTENKGPRIVPGELEPLSDKKIPLADVTIIKPPTPNVQPSMQGASPTYIPTPVPAPLPKITPTPAPIPVPAATPAPLPKSPQDAHATSSIVKNLRTYEGDIAEVLAGRGTSSVSAAIAESKRKGEGATIRNTPEAQSIAKPAPKPAPRDILQSEPDKITRSIGSKIVIVLICIILIGIGSIAGYYLYERSPLVTSQVTPVKNTPKATTSIMPSEYQTVISTDNLNGQQTLKSIRAEIEKKHNPATIKEIVLTETKEGAGFRVSAPEIIALLDIPVPDIISRTLTPQWMLGSYSSPTGEQSVFLIFNTNLFQNAFAGMLAWEKDMPERYKDLLATSTNYLPAPKGTFKDGIIRNKDLRSFITESGTLFEYSFVDNSTLVIAANDTAMAAIIARLENRAYVR